MSAIAAIIGPGLNEADDALVRRMLAAAAARGSDVVAVWRSPNALLAVARHAWELGADFSGGVTVLEEDGLVVAADASLYYRAELHAALCVAGQPPRGASASHYLLAAWRAWGSAMVNHLEGDFAFVLWNEREQRLLAARDFQGPRPLFHAQVGERLYLASALGALSALPALPKALNLTAIAEDACSFSSLAVTETAYQAIHRLPAGWRLEAGYATPSATSALSALSAPYWSPPVFERWDGTSTDDAAERLRMTLAAAVQERSAGLGPTAVWLSGGYDSTAVLAAGRSAGASNLIAVSMSYPEGDPGREDERIAEVAVHCGTPVTWVQSGAIGPLENPAGWGDRDEPSAHAFAPWNRALARATMGQTARVALNGNGGDQFFGVSPVFLADLLRSGGVFQVVSEARALGLSSASGMVRWAAVPALSDGAATLAGRLRGNRTPRHYLQEQVPAWLRQDFARASGLLDRRRPRSYRRPGETHAAAETAWYLQGSFGPRIISQATALSLAEGVEQRTPLYDARVIALAASRPREERCSRGEKKRLLRQAMRGLLPDSILGPRPHRTGLPGGWLRRWMLASLPPMVATLDRECLLADLGVVEPAALRADWTAFTAHPEWEAKRGGGVLHALAAETWLRRQAGSREGFGPALVA